MGTAALVLVAVLSTCFADTNIPAYVKLCKRHDENLNKCLLGMLESIKPHLAQGVKEFGIPPLDPLEIECLDDKENNLGLGLHGIASDIKISRGSNFELNELSFDPKSLKTYIDITFPKIDFTADYNANGSILNIPVKCKGETVGEIENIRAKVNLTGTVEWKGKKEYIKLLDVSLKYTSGNYSVPRIAKMVKKLNITTETQTKVRELLRPTVEHVTSKIVAMIVKKFLERVSLTDFLPLDTPREPIPAIGVKSLLAQ